MKSMLQTSSNPIAVPQKNSTKGKKPKLYNKLSGWCLGLFCTRHPCLTSLVLPTILPKLAHSKRLIISGNGLEIGSTPG